MKADLSTVRTVLWLTLATNIVTLFVNALSTVYGFLRGPRQVEDPPKHTWNLQSKQRHTSSSWVR